MMEEIVNEAETFEITDSERNLKRNIDAVANQTNENLLFRSPARKEMRIEYEMQLKREHEQWKKLIIGKTEAIEKTLSVAEAVENMSSDLKEILDPAQLSYLKEAANASDIMVESNEFRDKRAYLLQLNQLAVDKMDNIQSTKKYENILKGIELQMDFMDLSSFVPLTDQISDAN